MLLRKPFRGTTPGKTLSTGPEDLEWRGERQEQFRSGVIQRTARRSKLRRSDFSKGYHPTSRGGRAMFDEPNRSRQSRQV